MATQSETFCPSIYELLRKRILVNQESHACGALYIPDSVYISESKIMSWHFTSKYAGYVLRKSKENLTPDAVYQCFASAVHPLDICCICVMVDMNRSADVIRRVEYLCPFQLYSLLSQLKQIDITALLVKHINELPDLQQIDGDNSDDAEEEQNKRLRKAIQEIRLKFNIRASGIEAPDAIQLKSENYKHFQYVKQVKQSTHYDVIKVIYTPGVIQALGRRSLVAEDSRREPPGRRCATFFSDAEKAEGHSISQTVLLGLNQAFARTAMHINIELSRPVLKIVAYVRVFNVPSRRKEVQGPIQKRKTLKMAQSLRDLQAPQLIQSGVNKQQSDAAQKVNYDNENNDVLAGIAPSQAAASEVLMDGETMSVIQMRIRKNFLCPQIICYDSIKDIMKQFYFQTFTQIVKAAIKINIVYQIKPTDHNWLNHIMNDINSDLKSDRLQRQRVYAFFNGVLEYCLLTDRQSVFNEQQADDEVAVPKNDLKGRYCCRCRIAKSQRLVKLKMLLAEPIYYFQSKFTFPVNISKLSIRDCYALLHVCLFKDLSVMRFCDSAYQYLKSQELTQKRTLTRNNSIAMSVANTQEVKTTGVTSESGEASDMRSEYQKSVFFHDLVSGSEGEEYDQLFAGLESFEEEQLSGIGSHEADETQSLGGLIEAPPPPEFRNGREFSELFDNSSLELKELRDFFALLKKIQKQSEKRRLDLYNLGRFYDVSQNDFGNTCVPDKLLRNCGVARVSMEPLTFLQRTTSENFMGRHLKVCNQCFKQLVTVWRSLDGDGTGLGKDDK